MKLNPEERALVFKLLEENSTLGDVRFYLKSRGKRHSAGSWKQLITERLTVALEKGDLSRDDLIQLLRLSEEHGKQHVFLYECSREQAGDLMSQARVERSLKQMNLSALITSPRILYQPRQPTITDVRWESDGGAQQSLVIKVVKQRRRQELVGESVEGEYLVRRYREVKERAVSLFRLSPDGILELRIFSHQNSSDYQSDVAEMWGIVGQLLSRDGFSEYSIANAKGNLWQQRAELRGVVQYSDSKMKNSHGITLSAATGTDEANLVDDEGTSKSVETFLRYDAHCDSLNIWWLTPRDKKSNELPSKDIHMMLTRSLNEFVLTSKCSREDYEHVFGQLKRVNEKTAKRA